MAVGIVIAFNNGSLLRCMFCRCATNNLAELEVADKSLLGAVDVSEAARPVTGMVGVGDMPNKVELIRLEDDKSVA